MFVANEDANSVTELNGSTGALIRVRSAAGYEFNGPAAIVTDGGELLVASYRGQSVTSFPAG